MTEVAQVYLGNIHRNSNLGELVSQAKCLEVILNPSDRAKGRIHARTETGETIGIIKNRDRLLESGDLFETNSQKLLLVHLQEPKLLVLDFSNIPADFVPVQLVHLGHILGNHHYPIAIEDNKIYIELTTEARILEKIIKDLSIPDLKIRYETQKSCHKISFSIHHH